MTQLNQILSWDNPFLSGKVVECKKTILFFEVLSKVARVGLALLALVFLIGFGLLNPNYLPISSTLLFVAYHPSIEVTVGTLDRWVDLAKKEHAKYEAIIGELEGGKSIPQAQIAALKERPLPPLDEKQRECQNNLSSVPLRQELLELKRERALNSSKKPTNEG